MNHTSHYSLNQWEDEDRVLRTEFNADNEKLDAAIAAVQNQLNTAVTALQNQNCMEKMISVVTTAAIPQVDLDLSGIDMSRYRALSLYVVGRVTGSYSQVYLRMNNMTSGYKSGTSDTPYISMCKPYLDNYAAFTNLQFTLFDQVIHILGCRGGWGAPDYYSADFVGGGYGIRMAPATLQSINIFAAQNSAATNLLAGSEFHLYGVKK